jgi:hypothetical protein
LATGTEITRSALATKLETYPLGRIGLERGDPHCSSVNRAQPRGLARQVGRAVERPRPLPVQGQTVTSVADDHLAGSRLEALFGHGYNHLRFGAFPHREHVALPRRGERDHVGLDEHALPVMPAATCAVGSVGPVGDALHEPTAAVPAATAAACTKSLRLISEPWWAG